MADSSFDIVSEINHQELTNAVDQAKREIGTRFDFKGTNSEIELTKENLELSTVDEGKLKQLIDVLHSKLIKRGISLKALDYGNVETASGARVRQKATFVAGVEGDMAKKIHKLIKESPAKVKSSSMDQIIRVTGKSKDDLQKIMKLLKESDQITIPLQFKNFK